MAPDELEHADRPAGESTVPADAMRFRLDRTDAHHALA